MIKVLLPANNQAERQYAAEVLLVEWLGLSVQFLFGETAFSAALTLENGNHLFLEDHFFSAFPAPLSYLNEDNIPQKIRTVPHSDNPFLREADLPVLFGNDHLQISQTEITCGIDIFAATFFMLTRWEEYVLPDRDSHERFPAKASLAGKHQFLHRPVVNEYVEMVWNMLTFLGIGELRKKRKFEALLTHDVDMPQLWRSFPLFVKKMGGDLLKRHSLTEFFFSIRSYFSTRWGKEKDPFDTFDYLMDCSDRLGLQSHFFFLCGGDSPLDRAMPLDTPFIKDLIGKIHDKGHIIGLHPSYDTINNGDQFVQEKKSLEQATGFAVKSGRQHFLRFEAPNTWQSWEDNGMKWDSSLYYAEQAGFRCGICFPFPVFNFLTRKKLRLQEIPLSVMEGTYPGYKKIAPEIMFTEIKDIIHTIKKYEGVFVLLWHNSSFNTPTWSPFSNYYEKILEVIKQ